MGRTGKPRSKNIGKQRFTSGESDIDMDERQIEITSPKIPQNMESKQTPDMADILYEVKSTVENNNKKLDKVGALLDQTQTTVQDLKTDIADLQRDNSELRDILEIMEGRILKLEMGHMKTESDIEDIQYRSMKINAIFYGVKKQDRDCIDKIKSVLTQEMKIPQHMIGDTIKIDVAHPIGSQAIPVRPIVVKFVDRSSKLEVMRYAYNLKDTGISVADQLPDTMRERRSAQVPEMKRMKAEIRLQGRDPKEVTLHQATLKVRGVAIDPHFTKSPLVIPINNIDPNINDTSINHTPIVTVDSASLQGHVAQVNTTEEAATVVARLMKTHTIAKATHNVYAYRAPGKSGGTTEGYNDDGVWGTGKELLEMMTKLEIVKGIIVITKWKRGPLNKQLIGPFRKLVKDTARLGAFNAT